MADECPDCGEEVCLEIAQTSPIDVSLTYKIGSLNTILMLRGRGRHHEKLRILLVKLYAASGFRGGAEVLKRKSNSNMQFGYGAQKLMHYSGLFMNRPESV
ncbi:hypothetical protein SBDP2_1530006 [Syntrophobacter sp. SbD2]|nr:hypothetical protein SBDP2_1530006 [Syntrophobacter sp. SbD2]